jgi:hypothetical protein
MTGEVIEGEIVKAEPNVPPPIAARGPAGLLAAVSVGLLIATVVLGTLFVRERSAHDEDRRHQRAQSSRSVQRAAALSAELAAVRAQRDEAVDRLARAERRGLAPEAVASIRACVKHYADLERALNAGSAPVAVPGAVPCMNAEPYVRCGGRTARDYIAAQTGSAQTGSAQTGSAQTGSAQTAPKTWVQYGVPSAFLPSPTPTALALQLRMLALCPGLFIHAVTTCSGVR